MDSFLWFLEIWFLRGIETYKVIIKYDVLLLSLITEASDVTLNWIGEGITHFYSQTTRQEIL